MNDALAVERLRSRIGVPVVVENDVDAGALGAVARSGPRRFLTVSDTTATWGHADGPVRLGDQEAVVTAGTVRLADGTLSGSADS